MERRNYLKAIGALSLTALAGCAETESKSSTTPTGDNRGSADDDGRIIKKQIEMDENGLRAYYDPEGEMVCYIASSDGAAASGAGWQSGLSSVPIEETAYDPSDFGY